jgi:hypothetical protein
MIKLKAIMPDNNSIQRTALRAVADADRYISLEE